jgi:hypothetical protein
MQKSDPCNNNQNNSIMQTVTQLKIKADDKTPKQLTQPTAKFLKINK